MSRETEASTVLPPKAMLTSRRATAALSAGASVGDIGNPVRVLDLGEVQRGQRRAQLFMFSILFCFRKSWVMAMAWGNSTEVVFSSTGQFQGGCTDHRGADRGRVGARRGDRRAVLGGHVLDVGVGDVRAEDLHLALELLVLDGEDGALGELVEGAKTPVTSEFWVSAADTRGTLSVAVESVTLPTLNACFQPWASAVFFQTLSRLSRAAYPATLT